MLTWVPFGSIEARHLRLLAKSLLAAPEAVRIPVGDMIVMLANGTARMFEFAAGLIVVREDEGRLLLEAIACDELGKAWQLVAPVKRLAADYRCHTIKTTVFDERLARAIRKLGGRVEAIDLVLPVEQEDERQQN